MALNPTAMILGGGGQDGYFLNELLSSQGYKVILFTHKGGEAGPPLDVSEFDKVEENIRKYRPDLVFHLAARSSTRHEFVLENHRAIVDGTLSILEAIDRHVPEAKVFIASSGLVFRNRGNPINEDCELVTDTAYALARVEALHIARYYRQRGRRVYVGFLFNHESPMRPPHSVVRKIARGVLAIQRGEHQSLSIGNATVVREWMWAGDAASAMLLMLGQDKIVEACIGDGIGRSLRQYAATCCRIAGIELDGYLEETPGYEAEYASLVSDPSRMKSIGWEPQFDMVHLAERMLEAEGRCRT